MKKQTARTFLVALVVLASLFSYVYLNTVTLSTPENTENQYQLMEGEEEETKEGITSNMNLRLPEVAVIKKVIETGKRLVPGS